MPSTSALRRGYDASQKRWIHADFRLVMLFNPAIAVSWLAQGQATVAKLTHSCQTPQGTQHGALSQPILARTQHPLAKTECVRGLGTVLNSIASYHFLSAYTTSGKFSFGLLVTELS